MNESRQDDLRQIASKMGFGDSGTLIEILDILLSDEEARWILTLPATARQLAERLGEQEERLAAGLQDLFMRGLVLPAEQTDEGPLYVAIENAGLFKDSILVDTRYERLGTHFLDLWRDFYNDELVHAPRSPDKLGFRIVPVEKEIQDTRGVLASERISEIIRQARRITVELCPCRLSERACDAPLETCIALDKVADMVLIRQVGREIGVDEALTILRKAEELGLVHTVDNSEHPSVICACCPCCCGFLRAITHYQKEHVVVKSRYCASIEQEKCTQCEICLGRCHFGAIEAEENSMVVDPVLCFGCGLCASTCPNDAITMVQVRGTEYIPSTEAAFFSGMGALP